MRKLRLSRRCFLRTGVACLTGAAVDSQPLFSSSADKGAQAVSRTSLKNLQAIPTTCQQCPAGCGIVAYLNGDQCVQVLGNPDHPVNQGAICAKGIAGLNRVYDPDRILFPLKRTGPRGEGEWTRITWDEAYQTLVARLDQPLFSDGKPTAVFDIGQSNPLLSLLMERLGHLFVIQRQELKRMNLEWALKTATGSERLIPDIRRSRTILNFGANPLAHHELFLGLARRICQAKTENGAKLYTFDVRMSETAVRSNAWFPVRSGTDGAVALAMADVILKKNLADRDFLSGLTETSLQNLKSLLSPFSLPETEKISGVSAAKIEEIAGIFASQKPSVALAGGGVADHRNGVQNVRSVLLLNWLVGNLEKEGGLYFPRLPYHVASSKDDFIRQNRLRGTNDLTGTDSGIDFYFSCFSNPAFEEVGCQNIIQYFRQEDQVRFLVVMDTHMTETAMLADLVLPAATPLESWGLESAPSFDQKSILNLRQPVVSLMSPSRVLRSPDFEEGKITEASFLPRGEAKDIGQMCIELASRLGGTSAEGFPFKSVKEFVSHEASKIPGLAVAGGLQRLQKDGFWLEEPDKIQGRTPKKQIHLIPTVENSSERGDNQAFPEIEGIKVDNTKEKDEFILTTYRTGLNDHETANSKWLREISHENVLWINRRVAEEVGIKTGDLIELSSSSGSLVIQALVTDRIHPESVALAEGFGHTASGSFACARKTKTKDRDSSLVWWSKKGPGANPKMIISALKDRTSGVYISKDTRVRIKKTNTEV